jgi:hypothetical protein
VANSPVDAPGTVVEYSKAELARPSPVPTVTLAISGGLLAFDPSGNLWVGNGTDVAEFSRAEIAKSGSPKPVLSVAGTCSLAFDSSGDLWVGSGANRLSEFTKAQLAQPGPTAMPKVVITSDSLDGPCRPAFDHAGNIWAGNFNSDTVVEFTKAELAKSGSPAPKVVISLPLLSFGVSSGPLTPGDVAFAPSGDLWVPNFDPAGFSVLEFTRAQLAKSGSPTPALTIAGPATGLNSPWAVAIEP